MNVTKLTYDQYVAVVGSGGQAISFLSHDFGGVNLDAIHARNVLHSSHCRYDRTAGADSEGQVYYTLTE